MEPVSIILAIAALAAGYVTAEVKAKRKIDSTKSVAESAVAKAKKQAEGVLREAHDEAKEVVDEARQEGQKRRAEIASLEERLADREKSLDTKLDQTEQRAEKLRQQETELKELKEAVLDIRTKQQEKLEKVAKLTKTAAAEKLMTMTERDIREDLKGLILKLQQDAKDQAEDQAGAILVATMERMASEVTAERTITAVKLEDDDMKGRIIGKEGRNIQASNRPLVLTS